MDRWRQCAPHIQKAKKWLPRQRPLCAKYLHSVDRPLKLPSITNCLIAILLTKPVIAILVPKLVAMATTLRQSISTIFSSDSLTTENPPLESNSVASYHTTKVIARQSHRASYSKCIPNLVAMATSLSTSGLPSNTWFLGPIHAHNPNVISIGSAIFAQLTAEFPYTLQWDAPFPLQNCPFPWGSGTPSNTLFLGPTRVHSPNGISTGSTVLCRAH